MEQYTLNFNNCYTYANIDNIPEYAGIYICYKCSMGGEREELLYIGETENIRERIKEHKSENDIGKNLSLGEHLCFSVSQVTKPQARVTKRERLAVENALIYKNKPTENTQGIENYNYDTIHVSVSSDCKLLRCKSFTIYNEEHN